MSETSEREASKSERWSRGQEQASLPTSPQPINESGTGLPGLGPLERPRTPLYFRWLTYILIMPLMIASTAFFGTISLICGLWDKSGRQQHAIAHLWARSFLALSLSPVRLFGLEHVAKDQTAVYASNHLSYFDTPVLFSKLPFQFRIVAKQGLWKVPFIGWYLNRSGQVPVDQSSARAAISSLSRGVKTLQSGLPLMIFPEGGRSASGQPKEFVAGAAWMAIKAGVPIVPITLVGTYELLPIHVYHLHPRPLAIIIGEPISTEGLTTRDADALTKRVRQVITETYMRFHPAYQKD